MDDQASKSSTGALRPERARPTPFACPNIGISMIAMAAATVVQRLAGGTDMAIVFRFVIKTLGTVERTPLSADAVAGLHVGNVALDSAPPPAVDSSLASAPAPCGADATAVAADRGSPSSLPRSVENPPSAGASGYAEHPRDPSSACVLVSPGSLWHLLSTAPIAILPAAAQTTGPGRWLPCPHAPPDPPMPAPPLPEDVLNAFLGTLRCRYLPKQFLDTRGENRLL